MSDEKWAKMDKEDIEHFRNTGIRDANEFGDDTVGLSNAIAREFEHYADRWNPAKMARVMAMVVVLNEKLKDKMAYVEEQWDDVYEVRKVCPK